LLLLLLLLLLRLLAVIVTQSLLRFLQHCIIVMTGERNVATSRCEDNESMIIVIISVGDDGGDER